MTVEIPSRHIALVGANNAGKSNIITAIDWVLGPRLPYQLRTEKDDYFDTSKPIVIQAVLGDVVAKEKPRLMGLATNQQQRGALSKKTDPEIELTVTIPSLEHDTSDSEEDEGDDNSTTRPNLDIKLWGFSVYKKQGEIRKLLAQLIRVGSDRNVEDDLQASRWTPYGQLMKSVLEASPEYPDLVDLLSQVNDKIQTIFKKQKDSLLADARVVSYVDDISFQLTRQNNPSELLRYLEILVTEDSHQVNISKLGTGTQSAIIIGMLELALRNRSGDVKIFAVEEPDSFIHPHGVRHLAELVRRIGEDRGAQVILTTHSPALIAVLSPRDIVRVEKRHGQTFVFQSPGILSDPAFARYVDSESAEMFFAKKVVLVEGDTEKFLLPPLAAMLSDAHGSLNFDRRGISIISMDTKDNVVNYLKILNEFEIDTVVMLDHDFLRGSSCKALVSYLKTANKAVDDSSETTLVKDFKIHNIIVLRKGEIEDYVPEADLAAITGKSVSEIQSKISASKKTSDAFKQLFKTSKPMYARQIAEHYVATSSMPQLIEQIIKHISHNIP